MTITKMKLTIAFAMCVWEKNKRVDWVWCDGCGKWYHCECLKLKDKDIGNTFFCNDCSKDVFH